MSGDKTLFETDRRQALILAAGAAMVPGVLRAATTATEGTAPAIGLGCDQPFDRDWHFRRGQADGLEATTVDDSGWRKVDLPHDWSIEDVPGGQPPKQVGPFDKTSVGGTATGFTDGGEGWYRKHFRMAALPADAHVEIAFDGVIVESEIWLNGQNLGAHLHGYTPFAFDLTPHLRRDGDNLIAVRVRNLGQNSRWYAGSGIYRQVRINVRPTGTRIARWGVGAWTRRIEGRRAEVDVTTVLDNAGPDMLLVSRLRDASGRIAAEASSPADASVKQTLVVASAALWSPDAPHLYTLESELRRGKLVVDRLDQPFGIRIVTFDKTRGMRINDVPMKLRGGCIHHDNGLLGACAYPDADERRIRLLKARGFNAVRSSHNPASASLRNACDRLGMLMIDEAFDAWHVAKLKDDYSTHIRQDWQTVLAGLVLSARNSPSVIMWSIGNEIPDRATAEGVEWSWKFANEVHRLDPTRPVTAALHGVLGDTVVASEKSARQGFAGKPDQASSVFLDIAGYNYRLVDIEGDHKQYPDRIIYASETFPVDAWDYRVLADRAPYFLGEFVWTAMDYLGEAGVGATVRIPVKSAYYIPQFPWVNAWCGDIDLIGQQKPQSLARDVIWGRSPLEIMVQRPIPEGKKEFMANWGWRDELPSWTWPDAGGKPMAIRVFTAGDKVELRLNGMSVGTRPVAATDKMCAEFAIAYTPGTLEAIAYRGGIEIGRRRLETIGAPVALRLTPEPAAHRQGRDGLRYVGIELLDAQGRLVPEAELPVRLAIHGPMELAGFGSANPMAVGSFQSVEAKTFRGRALAILRSTVAGGTARIEASSAGIRGGAATL